MAKKSLNLKNIKNTLECLNEQVDSSDYIDFFDALYEMYIHGFIDRNMWNAIFEFDTELYDRGVK